MKYKYYFKIIYLMLVNTSNPLTAIFTKKVILKSGQVFFIHNFMDWYVIIETVVLNCYRFENKNIPVIDIGAAFGDFSIFASTSPLVFSIEPEPETFNLLVENISSNNATNVKAFPLAINATKKVINLSINNKNHNNSNSFDSLNTISVPAVSLTEFINAHVGKSKVFIKCDCEGAEYDIFKNLPAATYKQISAISMEYHLFTKQHIQNFAVLKRQLFKNQFIVTTEANPVHSNIGFLFAKQRQK